MTLGYFLRTFLGIENLAFGDISGKIGTDWWPIETERFDDMVRSYTIEEPQTKKTVKLWAFKEGKNGFKFFHPRLRKVDGGFLELVSTRLIHGTGELIVWAKKNGKPPEIPMLQVHQLHEIAIQTLSK